MKKKKAFAVTAAAVMAISILLGGCSSSKETSDQSQGDGVQLTFWRNSGNDAENKVYEELIKSYEKENPTVDVKMTPIPFADYSTKLRTALASGSPPDIFAVDSPDLGAYAEAGALLSIDKYMKEEGEIEDIPESTLSGLSYKDQIYLAPIVQSGIVMFYNKKMFEKAGLETPSEDPKNPWTWDQVLEAAKKINDPKNGVYGIDPAQGFSEGEGPAYFKSPILWQFGGEILNPEGTSADGFLNSPESLKALQFYQDLYQKEKVAAVELPPDPFATGKLGISIDGSWALAHFSSNFPDFKLGEDYGVAPLPKGEKQVAPNGGWTLGISAKTKQQDEAWKFIKYLTSYEGQKTYVEATGDIPVRYSVAKEIPELNEYPKNIFLVQSQEFSKNRPVTPAYPTVSKAMKKLFEDVGIGNRDVKASAEEAVMEIDKALQSKK
ncbi:ABC transporter substrate-binding protein [Bacillus capparidis]|uniref:ABC-type glycerol-3-phosphate transport system substrate-binding protein n=1 Tax=Bacillus capparidis TaxID=1840411 RepID=A0ABS4CZN7_9BACI|nr:sugar ABC transporter substrate-binding protein [Bacillus capparidis]MBP1082805.1 ABC-type glycerol-3-phosphate transport system substrate-binding protein [Bacillus capparidis]MED1098448.1 sugar ABC transporter substrate-binding protein [Bacillus capparidis]